MARQQLVPGQDLFDVLARASGRGAPAAIQWDAGHRARRRQNGEVGDAHRGRRLADAVEHDTVAGLPRAVLADADVLVERFAAILIEKFDERGGP
jgi:hypothetical protein